MPFDGSRGARTVAARMRTLFGPNGEYWCKGRLTNRVNGVWSACLHGAYLAVVMYDSDIGALANTGGTKLTATAIDRRYKFLMDAVLRRFEMTNSPASFNDYETTTFADIVAVLDDMEQQELAAWAKEGAHAV